MTRRYTLPRKDTGFGLVEIIVLVAVVGLLVLIGWQLYTAHRQSAASPPTSLSQTGTTSQDLSSGSNDQDLQSDLNGINNNLSQGSQNLDASDGAVNDQQNQISIPTN